MITAETIRQALECENPSCACHKPGRHVHCPAHTDSTPSLSVTDKNGKTLVKCHGGCPQDRVIASLKKKELWPSSNGGGPQARMKSLGKPLEVYDYQDADGKLVFQVCRYQTPTGKTFRQRRPDSQNSGKWIWNLAGIDRVPYRLPELLQADAVFVPEGEKDADNLAGLGLTATCNPMGAGKWRKNYNQHFKGKAVVILPDNDDSGRAHALDVARSLYGIAGSIKIIELPGLAEKGDVSDWLDAGGTIEELLALVEAAPEFSPAQDQDVPPQDQRPTQAELLIALAADAELFHDLNRKGYATVPVGDHLETWPIKSMAFRDWLRGRFYKAYNKPPPGPRLYKMPLTFWQLRPVLTERNTRFMSVWPMWTAIFSLTWRTTLGRRLK